MRASAGSLRPCGACTAHTELAVLIGRSRSTEAAESARPGTRPRHQPGAATCYDSSTGTAIGTDPTTLRDTLFSGTNSSPTTALTRVVHLTETASAGCGGSGTATFSYTLTRTGSISG